MHLTYIVHSRVWVVLVALAILGVCIAAFVFLSGKSQEPFGFDELYGLLDLKDLGSGNQLSTREHAQGLST
jgi:hypothetical protein